MKTLCESHVKALIKVTIQLHLKEKMDWTQLILGEENTIRIEEAEHLLNKAIDLLRKID